MISPLEIAKLLSLGTPTEEQAQAISGAPVDSPAAVVAGAGSGKTELMASRVLWLVANGLAEPVQILGLTFTRKAARELNDRINKRLIALRETDLWPQTLNVDFDPPRIATYNSFANEVFRSVSLEIGYESNVPLLGEAGSYLAARRFLEQRAAELAPKVVNRDRKIDSLVELVLALEAELGEHQLSAKELAGYIGEMSTLCESLPRNDKSSDFSPFAYISSTLESLFETIDIAVLAEGYRSYKKEHSVVDYSDQLRLAAGVIAQKPELAQSYRDQYRQVLLDEYQDTSSVQVRMLASLFGGRGVLAVGDPNQSIYGWRGAAAGTMQNFGRFFGHEAAPVFPLSTNWRSETKILTLANQISSDLDSQSSTGGPASVQLQPRPGSGEGKLLVRIYEDEDLEAQDVAEFLRQHLTLESSAAILFRKRKHMARFASALDSLGVNHEISGLGGLLQLAEVADLVAALRVIAEPESGVSLMRLLSGPRWRVNPSELAQLNAYAKRLENIRSKGHTSVPVTLIEALDELANPDPVLIPEFSKPLFARLKNAATVFRVLRKQTNLSLSEFARAVVAELWLDIELLASERREPLVNLHSFYDLVSEFETSASERSLEAFLGWLVHAEKRQRLEPPKSGVRKGVVQLLTIHSSKGLEWDTVVVPDLVEGEFPSEERSYKGWLSVGRVPYELRADVNSLPTFDWAESTTQKDFQDKLNSFRAHVKDHLFEEQGRLAYVAFTRAKSNLLLSASHWGRQSSSPRPLSRYLQRALEVVGAPDFGSIESEIDENPLASQLRAVTWPRHLSETTSLATKRLADEVLESMQVSDHLELAVAVDELLESRSMQVVELPSRLSATALANFISDPKAFASRLARPLPAEYLQAATVGTLFHAAVESAYSSGTPGLSTDDLEEFGNLGEFEQGFVDNFMLSKFAALPAKFVEQPVQFVLGDLVVVCKLDAVFEVGEMVEIVDWKTGSANEIEKMRVQLSVYRLALSKLFGMNLEKISAGLFFVASGAYHKSTELFSESELVEMISKAKTTLLGQDTPR